MVSKVFFLILSFTSYGIADVSKEAIHGVTLNNCKVAAQSFASKLVKGNLDDKGYTSLREKVGFLEKGQKLKANDPVFLRGSLIEHYVGSYENSWTVSLEKVSGRIPNNTPPLFAVLVHCIVKRGRQSLRGSPYEWDPNCKVAGVVQE